MAFPDDSQDENTDFAYMLNSSWLAVITMTTVGYGDMYPRTHPGRFVAVFGFVIG